MVVRWWGWGQRSHLWHERLASAKGNSTYASLYACLDVGQREREKSEA